MAACDFIKINGTDIPGVTGISTNRVRIEDRARTINGHMRTAIVTTKREWRVPLRVTGTERQAVAALVDALVGTATVTIDEIGTVTAYVTINSDSRAARRSGGAWDFLGGNLELLIEEA